MKANTPEAGEGPTQHGAAGTGAKLGLYWPGEEGTLVGQTTSRVCLMKWGERPV